MCSVPTTAIALSREVSRPNRIGRPTPPPTASPTTPSTPSRRTWTAPCGSVRRTASRNSTATTWTSYTTADGLAGNTVYSLTVGTNNGTVWAGTNAGLSRLGEHYPRQSTTMRKSRRSITIDGVYPQSVQPDSEHQLLAAFGRCSRHSTSTTWRARRSRRFLRRHHERRSSQPSCGMPRTPTASAASSGVYFVTLNMKGLTAAQRMTLVR